MYFTAVNCSERHKLYWKKEFCRLKSECPRWHNLTNTNSAGLLRGSWYEEKKTTSRNSPPHCRQTWNDASTRGCHLGRGRLAWYAGLSRRSTWDEFFCLKCPVHLLRWYVIRVPAMYTLTHTRTHKLRLPTVLITSAVSKTRCGSQPQHRRRTLVATSCIASSLPPPHSAVCLDDLSTHHEAQRTLASHQGASQSYSSPRPDAVSFALPTATAAKVP